MHGLPDCQDKDSHRDRDSGGQQGGSGVSFSAGEKGGETTFKVSAKF